MNEHDNHELETLRDRVAALEARDARRESEHVSLLNSYAALATGRETLRRDLETDYTLLGKSFDARISELAQRISGGSNEETLRLLAQEIAAFARDLGQLVRAALDDREGRIMERMIAVDDQMLDVHGKLLDRIEALESGPRLAAR